VNRKKSTGIIASAALAVFGMLLLFMFAKGRGDQAEQAAQAAAAPAEPIKNVYVATIDIPKGVPGESVETQVKKIQVPQSQLVVGADADLDFKVETIRGKLTAIPISANQQITNAMFESTEVAAAAALPPGKVAVTLIIPGERVAGIGRLNNETVGVVASFAGAEGGSVTHYALHKVQIVGRPMPYGGAPAPTTVAGTPDTGTTSFVGQVQVTLAVNSPDAERLIFMNQFGTIHLVSEPLTAKEGNEKIVNQENVYQPAGSSSAADAKPTSTTKPGAAAPAAAPTTVAAGSPAPTTVAGIPTAPTTAAGIPTAPTTVKK
jgi:pilus assembly protein CpaB